jgi:histone H3/H4
MVNLMRAHKELYRRQPDERFATLDDLWKHCCQSREASTDRWTPPSELEVLPGQGRLQLSAMDQPLHLNDWSFTQLCSLSGVSKDTVNRLSPHTASQVFAETLPGGNKPLQLYTTGDRVRSVHGASYTRLHNVELLSVVREFATDFVPAHKARTPDADDRTVPAATGLYAGEQDAFVFLHDPTGWIEINGEAFAPGFFLWNSEVGRRSVGIQTYWYQQICANHIVWDAVDVVEFSRKHTANVHDALSNIRQLIERIVAKRDERRDRFADVIRKAMGEQIGEDAEEALKVLRKNGIPKNLASKALEHAEKAGRFTVFSVVHALTELAGKQENAGDRTALDAKSSALLSLVA